MDSFSSPLLDEYNRTGQITPGLQKALDITRQKLGQQFQLPAVSQPAQAPSVSLVPPGTSVPTIHSPIPATAPVSATQPAPQPHAPTPHEQELTRLTTGDTGKSGIEQIHNPWLRTPLRVLDAIGSQFAPVLTSFLPGTQLHHQMLVNHEAENVGRDEKMATEEANRAHLGAETAELGSRGKEEAARADALANPPEKQGDPTKTIETDKGIMQFNPETGKYDIPVGNAPGKEQGSTHVLPDGSVVEVHHDPKTGKSSAEVLYQGKPQEKPGHVIQRLVNGKMHNVLVDAETGKDRADLGETRQPNAGADHGVTMIGPDGKVLRLEPGQTAPGGAVTPTQAGSLNTPTSQMRNVAAQAQLVHEQTPHMLSEIDRLKDRLGPMAGRWGEFMQGKVGMNDPEFAGLRADLLMYSSAVALMHARGRLPENLREEFDRTINNPGQDFQNLKAVIGRIDDWTGKNLQTMGGRASNQGGSGGSAPKAGDVVDGYKFKGGDPSQQSNWEQVKK